MLEQSFHSLEGIRQDDASFVHIPGRGAYPRASWLSHAVDNRPLRIWLEHLKRWDYIPRSFTIPDADRLITVDVASLDIGNRSAKLCTQSHSHQLVTLELPAILQPVPQNLRAGAITNTVWRVLSDESQEDLWVGDEAVEGGRGFPVGSTEERFHDGMYLTFLKIALAQLLLSAGHRETVRLALGIGIRNSEVKVGRQGQEVDPSVLNAIRALKGSFTVKSTSPSGEETTLTVIIERIWPAIQTLGAFFAYFYNLLCDPAQTEFKTIGVLDWGTGDLGYGVARYVEGKPLQIHADPIAPGVIQVAEALKATMNSRFRGLHYTTTMALQAIINGFVTIGGKEVRLGGTLPYPEASAPPAGKGETAVAGAELQRQLQANERWHLLNNTLNNAIQALLVDANPKMQLGDQLLLNVGGGLKVPTMAEHLATRLQALKSEEYYLLAPEEVTTVLNAIGLYVYVYWQLMLILRRMNRQVGIQAPH
ncbi:MAG TPA: hypothetical protein VKR06_08420 [Ktedonosporobacter sp.]|nr:hypothetical protein [Ktedonosporobacter sp.]